MMFSKIVLGENKKSVVRFSLWKQDGALSLVLEEVFDVDGQVKGQEDPSDEMIEVVRKDLERSFAGFLKGNGLVPLSPEEVDSVETPKSIDEQGTGSD